MFFRRSLPWWPSTFYFQFRKWEASKVWRQRPPPRRPRPFERPLIRPSASIRPTLLCKWNRKGWAPALRCIRRFSSRPKAGCVSPSECCPPGPTRPCIRRARSWRWGSCRSDSWCVDVCLRCFPLTSCRATTTTLFGESAVSVSWQPSFLRRPEKHR